MIDGSEQLAILPSHRVWKIVRVLNFSGGGAVGGGGRGGGGGGERTQREAYEAEDLNPKP